MAFSGSFADYFYKFSLHHDFIDFLLNITPRFAESERSERFRQQRFVSWISYFAFGSYVYLN
ncbi:MAG: hypothetical protein GY820_02770 [Gammaproteobacteria bacterium]|nr:hypothetical protein [Gammaproteobacteria bacterium]